MKADLSQKDEQFRDFSLNGSMGKVVLYVGFPLALYQSLNQLFKILDTMMASHIGASAVSAVAYLSQINMMLSALGGGLAVGAITSATVRCWALFATRDSFRGTMISTFRCPGQISTNFRLGSPQRKMPMGGLLRSTPVARVIPTIISRW